MSQFPQLRRIVLTGSIAAITATGAWYGAGLKMKQEVKKEVVASRQATPVERISQLETTRAGLVTKRMGLERKIAELEGRRTGKQYQVETGKERR